MTNNKLLHRDSFLHFIEVFFTFTSMQQRIIYNIFDFCIYLVHSADWFLDQFDGLIFENSIFGKRKENACTEDITTKPRTTFIPVTTNINLRDGSTSDHTEPSLSDDFLFDTG